MRILEDLWQAHGQTKCLNERSVGDLWETRVQIRSLGVKLVGQVTLTG